MFSQKLFKNLGCIIKNCRFYAKVKVRPCPRKPPPINVTIISAGSEVGRMTAMLLKRKKIFKNLFLYDGGDLSDLMCDMCLIDTNTKVTGFCGIKSLEAAIKEARIIFICDGLQTKCDMDEECLFKRNAEKVRQSVLYCTEFNPHAFLVIGSPPVASLVPMAIEEYKKADWLAGNRIFGVARTYVHRANSMCGNGLNIQPNKIHCQVIGGIHRRTCIPVLSQIKNAGIARKKNEILTRSTQEAEEDALHAMKQDKYDHGCYLSTAYASAQFIEQLAHAINGKKDVMECVYVRQKAPMNEYARYFTTVCNIGPEGIISSNLPKLSVLEKKRLKYVIEDIRIAIHMGETYITGNDRMTRKHRPIIDKPAKESACKSCTASKKKDKSCPRNPKRLQPPKSMKIEKPAETVCAT